VERAREGNPEGFHFLYVRYAPDVLHYVAGFVHDHDEAEDITRGLFATLGTEISMYEQAEGPFAAWILRTARKAAFDHVSVGTLDSDEP
jgi:DNA-directed RNA polymerase specialized sigma24 family protein